jgi:hypothetical protein
MPPLTPAQRDDLLASLEDRFSQHPHRHEGIGWEEVLARLEGRPDTLRILHEMQRTGGQPDVVRLGDAGESAGSGSDGGWCFVDCSPETPAGRRSLCYDGAARAARKKHPPVSSAMEMAATIGAPLLDEAEYAALQAVDAFDRKTSSWILTPPEVRKRGGALFGDRRYGRVFVYHNGADSYYAARGFRCCLRI